VRTLAHLSDLHFGRDDPPVVTALQESLRNLRPDLVVISGDLTQRARRFQFEAARKFFEQIQSPKLVIPGNHDIPLYNLFGRLIAPFSNYNRYIPAAAEAAQCFVDDEIAVLGLNTVRRLNWKNGRVSDQQLTDMAGWFAKMPPSVWKILVTHHPLAWTSDARKFSLAQRSVPAVKAAVKSGVHLVLSGHSHHAVNSAIDADLVAQGSLLVVHAGTAVSNRTRGQANTYNLITIAPPLLSVTIMEWSAGAGFREGAHSRYILRGSTWHAAESLNAPLTG
jgi:3',5'-cyclic AMP phosphodiesterase CpdA